MVDLIPEIRIAVRALIVKNDQVLLQHKVYENGSERFTLPGGAPEPGEPLEQGLRRECQEEIGSSVNVLEMLCVADLFKRKKEMRDTIQQQIEIIFRCEVPLNYTPRNGNKPDKHQVDVLWQDVNAIEESFFPKGLLKIVTEPYKKHPVYLGLIK
jgi:ADP-ribose pyrophosphatase YjhB (NUDIX family)